MSELQSNNPFRDRASPYTQSAQFPKVQTSTNPFLDKPPMQVQGSSAVRKSTSRDGEERQRIREHRERHLKSADKQDESSSSRRKEGHGASTSTSRDRAMRPPKSAGTVAATSSSQARSRPRSNSDTSIADMKKKEHSDSKKDKKSSSSKARSRKLDKIDLLDVTGFATTGAGFHHDGPFDACNPNRNKNSKKAPVLAFAKDSTAMSMAAGPPVQPVYFGDHVGNIESFSDYGHAGKIRPTAPIGSTSFDPTSKVEPIHGYESVGLGSTTFLEGAPASRSAMLARTTSDTGSSSNEARPRATSDHASGLGRKKSVLQKIRGAYRDRAAESEIPSSPPVSPYGRVQMEGKEYFDVKETTSNDVAVQESTSEPSYLSPLYRPASNGNNNGTTGLIKRVKSLRVGKKKE